MHEQTSNPGGVPSPAQTFPKQPDTPNNNAMTRTGKIARLPSEVRETLNSRLHEGESGRRLVAWLNSLPEVEAVLKMEFGGREVSEQNLCEWRQGGYRDWLAQQVAGRLCQTPGRKLAARYAVALADWNGESSEEFRGMLRSMRGLCQDVVELRRGDHSAAYLRMEQGGSDPGSVLHLTIFSRFLLRPAPSFDILLATPSCTALRLLRRFAGGTRFP